MKNEKRVRSSLQYVKVKKMKNKKKLEQVIVKLNKSKEKLNYRSDGFTENPLDSIDYSQHDYINPYKS